MNHKYLAIAAVCVSLFSGFSLSKAAAYPLYSPTWGFSLDLPEDYELSGGDNKDRFSFSEPGGASLDLVVYASPGTGASRAYGGSQGSLAFDSVEACVQELQKRLDNKGEAAVFAYQNKQAVFFQLDFALPQSNGRRVAQSGWGLCLELSPDNSSGGGTKALLLALAYGPAANKDIAMYHLSSLDSIAPAPADKNVPGPVTEYTFPRKNRQFKTLAKSNVQALFYENDAQAAQALIDREFSVLKRYVDSKQWQAAWVRFYRAIYRDSFDRLSHAAFILERSWNVQDSLAGKKEDTRGLGQKALSYVQSFTYERDLMGADFINLVSGVQEGRGDCDSRALLWAIILRHADLKANMMVSRTYGHAMGLADISGTGAHFTLAGQQWLVAETTAHVDLGLIGENVSETNRWLGIDFGN
ncbi:hypothetical protein ACYULU_12885 [Breznakiellaceae bacterium SP9]